MASRDDVNVLKGQLASISAQLDGLFTAAPALRKGYDRASVELALNRQNRMQSIRNFGLERYSLRGQEILASKPSPVPGQGLLNWLLNRKAMQLAQMLLLAPVLGASSGRLQQHLCQL